MFAQSLIVTVALTEDYIQSMIREMLLFAAQLSGVVPAGFSFSRECLPEADSMSLDKWERIG